MLLNWDILKEWSLVIYLCVSLCNFVAKFACSVENKLPDPSHLPKSTTCFFNILEKKMPGGETASLAPTWTLEQFLSR